MLKSIATAFRGKALASYLLLLDTSADSCRHSGKTKGSARGSAFSTRVSIPQAAVVRRD